MSAPALTRRAQAAHGGVQRGRPVPCVVRGVGLSLIGTGACGGRAWVAPVTKEQGGELFSGVRAGGQVIASRPAPAENRAGQLRAPGGWCPLGEEG